MEQVAPDGSPVAVYLAAPLEPEFTPVLQELWPPASVLDLGCGVGRLANELARRGLEVTGVDESEAMLAHLAEQVQPVPARIEGLDLGHRFDAVILASQLVNTADVEQRRALLSAARRHVDDAGAVYVEHYDSTDPGFRPPDGMRERRLETTHGPIEADFTITDRDGTVIVGRAEYRLDDDVWRQSFHAELLDDDALSAALAAADLRLARRLDPRWIVATP